MIFFTKKSISYLDHRKKKEKEGIIIREESASNEDDNEYQHIHMSTEVDDVNQHTLINIVLPSTSLLEVICKIKLPIVNKLEIRG